MNGASGVPSRMRSVNDQTSSQPQQRHMLVTKLATQASQPPSSTRYEQPASHASGAQRPSFVTSETSHRQAATTSDRRDTVPAQQQYMTTATTQYSTGDKQPHYVSTSQNNQSTQPSTTQYISNTQYSSGDKQAGYVQSTPASTTQYISSYQTGQIGGQTTQYSAHGTGQSSVQHGGASQHSQQQTTYYSSGQRQAQIVQGQEVETRQVSSTRVIGRETGPHRIVSVSSRVDETRSQIMNEKTTEREIRVPRRILREEVIEKVIIVPEKKLVEEFVDEIQTVKETVIEVAKPTIVEKIVEVPEIEIIERLVEVPEKKIEERIVHVEKIIEQERIIDEPEIVYQDKIVDVPVPEEKWTDVYVDVEVPEWRDEIRTREVRVPQYKEVPVPRQKNVEVSVDVCRDVPVPIEAEVSYEYRLPQLKPRYAKVTYPVYLPRFIEIPVASELLSPELMAKAQAYMSQVNQLSQSKLSLCEIEKLAADIMQTDFNRQIASANLQVEILRAWHAGSLDLTDSKNVTTLPSSRVVS